MKRSILLLTLVSLVGVAGAATVWNPAGNTVTPGSQAWSDPDNWTNGLPDNVEKAVFNVPGAAECLVMIPQPGCTQLVMGDNGPGGVLRVKSGASLTTCDTTWSAIGYNNTAHMIVEAGGTASFGQHLWIGLLAGGDGILDINGGTVSVGGMFGAGWNGGIGTVNVLPGGLLALSNIHSDGVSSIKAGSTLNLYGSGRVTLPGDFVVVVGTYIAGWKITGDGIPGNVKVTYDAAADLTTITVLNPLKFLQKPLDGPQYFGHDELSTAYSWFEQIGTYRGCYMADDFADMENTPVINVKWWGSYLESEMYQVPPVTRFLIVFETDIPAIGQPGDPDYIPSHPGQVIQSEIVNIIAGAALNPGEYTETLFSPGGPPCYEALYEYVAVLKNPFPQEPDTVYWIKIVALVDIDPTISLIMDQCGLSPCDLGKHSWMELLNICPGLEITLPITRWGWHNRDYTIMDLYASRPPAVNPGENKQGPLSNGSDVWHFQDDAVSGELYINMDDTSIFIDQAGWDEQYYRYWLPYCFDEGVDGPDDIEMYSKDLAFGLYTTEEEPELPCFTRYYPIGSPQYTTWVSLGEPDCWCYDIHQCGDVNGDCFVTIADDIMPMVISRNGGPAAYDPCADANYDGFVTIADDIMTAVRHRLPATPPHLDDGLDCLLGTCPTAVGFEIDGICDPVPSPGAILP